MRTRRRGQRKHERPLLSPLTSIDRPRRRSPRGRRLAVLVVFAAIIAAIVIVATTSGRSNGPTATSASRSPVGDPHPAKRVHHHRRMSAQDAAARLQAREIDRVLAYTPFLKQGLPRHRVIALTFDDGPSPYTEQIVSILVKAHVPATFFVVGQQLNDFASGLRDEIRHGFVIGDHTENHAWMIRLGAGGQFGQIHDAGVRIQREGAPFPRLFRPPYGAYNSQTLATIRHLGMLMVLWSIDPGDWRTPGTGAIISNVLGNAQPGAVVLMHDGGGNRSQTAAALPAIINGLRRRHYEFVTVPDLLRLDPPPRGQKLPKVYGV